MEDAFGIVVIVVSLVAIVVAVIALASSGRTFEQIGRGGLSLGEDGGAIRAPRAPAPAPIDTAEREDEIRQMLGARNARREARGEAPLDVEEELRALTAPAADPGLREEVRQLVEARNRRRVAKGQEPLDVEAEVDAAAARARPRPELGPLRRARSARALDVRVAPVGPQRRAMPIANASRDDRQRGQRARPCRSPRSAA